MLGDLDLALSLDVHWSLLRYTWSSLLDVTYARHELFLDLTYVAHTHLVLALNLMLNMPCTLSALQSHGKLPGLGCSSSYHLGVVGSQTLCCANEFLRHGSILGSCARAKALSIRCENI